MSSAGNKSPHSLFISDLHLCSSRPGITQLFIDFLQQTASKAEALYILGDLFEYWAGDDDLADPHHAPIIAALAHLAAGGTQLFFIHGNRDFLLGEAFAEAAGITILADPSLIELYGRLTLLSHGDALCTDDQDYQTFRQQVRNPIWQHAFLEQPLTARKAQIEALRARSEQEKSHKSLSIMDVNPAAVATMLHTYGYPSVLIHGHTHRPDLHLIEIDGKTIERWVLGDWYEQGSCLRCDQYGCTAISLNV